MASYGKPTYYDRLKNLLMYTRRVIFSSYGLLQLSHISGYCYGKKFTDLFGPPAKKSAFFYKKFRLPDVFRAKTEKLPWTLPYQSNVCRYSASIQQLLRILIGMANRCIGNEAWKPRYWRRVALNSVANTIILQRTPLNGCLSNRSRWWWRSLGAALYVYHAVWG